MARPKKPLPSVEDLVAANGELSKRAKRISAEVRARDELQAVLDHALDVAEELGLEVLHELGQAVKTVGPELLKAIAVSAIEDALVRRQK